MCSTKFCTLIQYNNHHSLHPIQFEEYKNPRANSMVDYSPDSKTNKKAPNKCLTLRLQKWLQGKCKIETLGYASSVLLKISTHLVFFIPKQLTLLIISQSLMQFSFKISINLDILLVYSFTNRWIGYNYRDIDWFFILEMLTQYGLNHATKTNMYVVFNNVFSTFLLSVYDQIHY